MWSSRLRAEARHQQERIRHVDAPNLLSISPTSGLEAGGNPVTIEGDNLAGTTSVTFGGAKATITANTPSQITATVPAGTAGTVDVSVTTAGGSSTSIGAYTYVAAPNFSMISPTSGPDFGGNPVTISGSNLSGATSVTFGGVPVTSFTVVSATQIVVTAPGGVAGPVDVTVTTVAGSATALDGYTYIVGEP